MLKMKKLQLNAPFLITFGLGLTFIYAGVDALANPANWIGYIPQWTSVIMPREYLLAAHAMFELLLGIMLIAHLYLHAVSFIVACDIAIILLISGVDAVTFRDFGLLMAAIALFILTQKTKEKY